MYRGNFLINDKWNNSGGDLGWSPTFFPRQADKKRSPNLFEGASQLVAIAGWAPEKILTSAEIEEELRNSPHPLRIDLESRTGVRERRVKEPSMSYVDMILKACEKLFSQSQIDPMDIDLVIHTGVCREYIEPATATLVHQRLGLPRATAFDVSNACLGFVDGWFIADSMIATGRSRLALVVTAEAGSKYVEMARNAIRNGEDPKKHVASLTLGDGSAAALFSLPTSNEDRRGKIIRGLRETYGKHSSLCIIPSPSEPMITQPFRLFEAALENFEENATAVLSATGWVPQDIDWVIPHQASINTMSRGQKILGLEPEKTKITIDRFGNMASASVPFTLAEALENKGIEPGSKILVTAFGSGLGIGFFTLQL